MEEDREGVPGEGSNLAFIVDSNIIFSVVVAGMRARAYRIIVEHRDLELFSPEEVLIEFREHTRKLKKSARVEFWNKALLAFSLIRIVPREIYKDALREAYYIAKTFDAKDTPFIALSIKLELPIWTEDKGLLQASFKPGGYVALDTEAVDRLVKGESLDAVRERLHEKLFKQQGQY